MHQGDPRDGKPDLYHINAVDAVTQWQVVGCVETISERHLALVLEAMIHQFLFRICGFHSDNGSKFINHRVAHLLEKLRIGEFTKSRANRTTDNALIEGKNGAVVRKYIGYGYLAAEHAQAFQRFYMAHLNPYLNFHRPCGFARVQVNDRGKRRSCYPADQYRTAYEKLLMLPDWTQYLKQGVAAERLARQATDLTDSKVRGGCSRRATSCWYGAEPCDPGSGTIRSNAKGRALSRRPFPLHSHPRLCTEPNRKEV